MKRCGFLLRNSISNPVYQGEEEGQVDGSRDFGAVAEVEIGEGGDELFDGFLRGGRGVEEFGLDGHFDARLERLRDSTVEKEVAGILSLLSAYLITWWGCGETWRIEGKVTCRYLRVPQAGSQA